VLSATVVDEVSLSAECAIRVMIWMSLVLFRNELRALIVIPKK